MSNKPSNLRRVSMFALMVAVGVLALTAGQQLNVVLLADTSTDTRQWPAMVDWAQSLIRSDRLLPGNYTIRCQLIHAIHLVYNKCAV